MGGRNGGRGGSYILAVAIENINNIDAISKNMLGTSSCRRVNGEMGKEVLTDTVHAQRKIVLTTHASWDTVIYDGRIDKKLKQLV